MSYFLLIFVVLVTNLCSAENGLPWQSMPEVFNRRSAKEIARAQAKESWQQQQIDQLRDDNRELISRLQEELACRRELYDIQAALMINLELALMRFANGDPEELKQVKADLAQQKKETQILAEALVASRNEPSAFQQITSEPLPLSEEYWVTEEDFDFEEDIEKNELSVNPQPENLGSSLTEDIFFISKLDEDEESEIIQIPAEMIFVKFLEEERPGFYISSRKVTNGEYANFVRGINYKKPTHWTKGCVPEGMENQPVVNISYEDAFLYAVWLGKRLPSEEELHRTFELNGALADLDKDISEWTATPDSKKSTHRIVSRLQEKRDCWLPNQSFNGNTGFRVASDSN